MSETTAPIETPQLLLEHHLKTLRLPTMLREYDRVARQCAVEHVNYPRYLLRMAELELLDRERRATERRIRQAKFPITKSLDSFDFLAMPTLNKSMVLELAPLRVPAAQGERAAARQLRHRPRRISRSPSVSLACQGGLPRPPHPPPPPWSAS